MQATQRSFFATIFLSADEPRLRAGWRLLLQSLLMGVLVALFNVPPVLYLMATNKIDQIASEMIPVEILLPLQIAEFLGITISVFLARRWFDRRSIPSLGLSLKGSILEVLAGIGIAFLAMTFLFLTEYFAGWLTVDLSALRLLSSPQVVFSTLAYALLFILTGWNEELLSRGYHLQNFSEGLGRPLGIIISSSIFGLSHLANPNSTWLAVFGIFVGGLFFAYAYYASGRLWLPIGIHIGWNFTQGVIYGMPVSGMSTFSLISSRISGPDLLSGGAFGPEGGLVLFPGLALGCLLIYLYVKYIMRRNHE